MVSQIPAGLVVLPALEAGEVGEREHLLDRHAGQRVGLELGNLRSAKGSNLVLGAAQHGDQHVEPGRARRKADHRQAGERDRQRSQLATAQLKGHQRASMAASGVDLGDGSAARVLTDTDVMGGIDADTIYSNAVRNAWGYRTDATLKRAGADAISPMTSATTSLIGGAGKVADTWYRFKGY